jgi:FkbM family methyltransferase
MMRSWLPRSLKDRLLQFALGYHSHAPSFSAAGEDMILRHVVGSGRTDGFYVDVGAYDPVVASNTYFFYLNGWRGINVEARPGSRERFERVRPRDINLEVGVAERPGRLTYHFISEDSAMNSFSREFLEYTGAIRLVRREIEVPVLPLAEILERHLPAGQAVDFMSVDLEGHDLHALASNDWERYRPRFVVVEDREVEREKSEVVSFMRGRGYEVFAQNVVILDRLGEYFFVDRAA